jgi:hypothetical protein
VSTVLLIGDDLDICFEKHGLSMIMPTCLGIHMKYLIFKYEQIATYMPQKAIFKQKQSLKLIVTMY